MKSTRVNISITPDRQEAFQAAAAKAGMSLSEWMRDCCEAYLPKKVVEKFTEVRIGRPKEEKVG